MDRITGEPCYKGTILRRTYRKITILWSFSYKTFEKFQGIKIWEPQYDHLISKSVLKQGVGAQLLSGRVLDSRQRGRGFKPHQRHSVASLGKNINPSLVLVQSNKSNKQDKVFYKGAALYLVGLK